MVKQVDADHYEFSQYVHKGRWLSIWHQVDEVLKMEPETVLEIGPGPGIFKKVISLFGPRVETLDIDPELKPDYVATADAMPFEDDAYDVVCAFQMLEHVPYQKSLQIFAEMTRVARKGIVISLPDAATSWSYSLYIPKFGEFNFILPRPQLKQRLHEFDGEHYWEINKLNYPLARIKKDLEMVWGGEANSYHRFFIFK